MSTKRVLVLSLLFLIPRPALAVVEKDIAIRAMKYVAYNIAAKFFVSCTAGVSAYFLARAYPVHWAIIFGDHEKLHQALRKNEYDHSWPLRASAFKTVVVKNDLEALKILATECFFSQKLALLKQSTSEVPALKTMCAKLIVENSIHFIEIAQLPRDILPEIFGFAVCNFSLDRQRALIAEWRHTHNTICIQYLVQAHCDRHFAYLKQLSISTLEELDFLREANASRNDCFAFIEAIRETSSFSELDVEMQAAIKNNQARWLGLEASELG